MVTLAVLQRVVAASITIDGHLVKSIQRGMLVLIALDKKNTERDVNSMVARILRAELWPSEKGDGVSYSWISKVNHSK
ncbi:unnamed protein product [Penicillium nalgiovense]|uniref:D-aminoacyl-tRNA deacylase n=1 Tax=Penicillium nalgiovense TaxID=60175 RepID=A0A9W4N2H2_PENNA|nr:unnamed protein product [Penicillium nalgiovense]CAG7990114.1 unnamed protein product [Penicillium nalgiovense]CAG8015578.1 unnamed protein product [Penicillium nalgiovense]CAG8033822.1 unnamed protein product [Penicillium nalgiovense]CAG8035659.1 unnamed protein product [Penicillium nalgiovense]